MHYQHCEVVNLVCYWVAFLWSVCYSATLWPYLPVVMTGSCVLQMFLSLCGLHTRHASQIHGAKNPELTIRVHVLLLTAHTRGCVRMCASSWLFMFVWMRWACVSELRPRTDLLFIPQMRYEHGEPWWNDTDRVKAMQSSPATRHGGAWGERRYSSYSFLTSALDGGK